MKTGLGFCSVCVLQPSWVDSAYEGEPLCRSITFKFFPAHHLAVNFANWKPLTSARIFFLV